MKVILTEDVPALGRAGAEVDVAEGYARNYLLPKKLALLATPGNVKAFAHQKKVVSDRLRRERRESEALAQRIEALDCVITRASGDQEKLFGSVTSMDLADYLKAKGIEVDRKRIDLEEPIKHIGTFDVPIRLRAEVVVRLKVTVRGEEGSS
ncbi:MAG: 50S ribosomal protein L9 [Deltaproteobacteria bacterium]|nr:50S ribosomal protein L9 [Deltaproteobacteria bacterium]